MKITVIGTGYLGAVHAACMAELGHDVLGVDVDPAKISALAEGRAPFYEPGLVELLERNTRNGRLAFSTSLAEAAAHGSVHFICVGTPQVRGSYAADLRYVDAQDLVSEVGHAGGVDGAEVAGSDHGQTHALLQRGVA